MASAKQIETKHQHWKQWIEGPLSLHMDTLLASREIQRSWDEIIENTNWHKTSSSFFHQWVNINYLNSILVAIRAITDINKNTRSLMRLLMDYKKHRPILQQLDIDTTRIENDIDQLTEIRNNIKGYVNFRIAHYSASPPNTIPTVGEIHQAATVIYDIYHHWHQTVCEVNAYPPTVTMTPKNQWEMLFTQPWITPEQAEQFSNNRKTEYEQRFGTRAGYLTPDERGGY